MESEPRQKRRKESRVAKNQQKHQSWLQDQKSQRIKRKSGDLKSKKGNKIKNSQSQSQFFKENDIVQRVSELKSDKDHNVNESKMVKGKKGLKRTSKTKFEEYLEMEVPNSDMLAQEDLELERKLAKKLKVKGGKLRGDDDGLNILFEDVPSALESWNKEVPVEGFSDEGAVDPSSTEKRKKKRSVEQAVEDDITQDSTAKTSELAEYAETSLEQIPAKAPLRKRHRKRKSLPLGQEGDVAGEIAFGVSQSSESHNAEVALDEASAKAPAMEGNVKYVAPHLRSRARNESEEQTQMRRRVRGLLNRLSESNVESITGEMATIFRSASRSLSSQIISEEVLASCYNGPRGNEQLRANLPLYVFYISPSYYQMKRIFFPLIKRNIPLYLIFFPFKHFLTFSLYVSYVCQFCLLSHLSMMLKPKQ